MIWVQDRHLSHPLGNFPEALQIVPEVLELLLDGLELFLYFFLELLEFLPYFFLELRILTAIS